MAHDDQNARGMGRDIAAFRDLAREVMSQLSQRSGETLPGVPRTDVLEFLDARMLARDGFDCAAVLDDLRSFNLTDRTIIDCYIPAAARRIGEGWVQSDLGFAEATIASVRLQSLLSEIAYSSPDCAIVRTTPIDALVVTLAGDQHTLGGFVAAAQLRRRGASVEISCGETPSSIENRVISGDYDVIMFSCSRSRDLEIIAQVIKNIRRRANNGPVFALGGIVLGICLNIDRLTKADLVTSDIDQVVKWCEQRPRHVQRRATR
jgi:hypothetical protein